MPWSTVRVQHHDGKPASGRRVVLDFGLIAGQTRPVLTNREGEAEIEHSHTGRAEVFVDGSRRTSFHAPGTVTVTS